MREDCCMIPRVQALGCQNTSGLDPAVVASSPRHRARLPPCAPRRGLVGRFPPFSQSLGSPAAASLPAALRPSTSPELRLSLVGAAVEFAVAVHLVRRPVPPCSAPFQLIELKIIPELLLLLLKWVALEPQRLCRHRFAQS